MNTQTALTDRSVAAQEHDTGREVCIQALKFNIFFPKKKSKQHFNERERPVEAVERP